VLECWSVGVLECWHLICEWGDVQESARMCKKVKHSMVHDIQMARAWLNFRLAEE
jgi:hypothetical protein